MNEISYLVLDYAKPFESRVCLESLREHSKFDHKVYFLCNGGLDQDYAYQYYKDGLIDVLIINKKNIGCGNSTVFLYDACDTDYAIYVQNDQQLKFDLTDGHIQYFINLLNYNNYACIDLAGAQGGKNRYSERASLMNVDFYKNIPKGEKRKYGGPGPFNYMRYVESYVQEYFEKNKLNIAHIDPAPFADLGKWSIREIGDGIYKHRCDTKQIYILQKPTYKTEVYPPFNDDEWEKVLNGEWKDGDIPEEWKKHSFVFWKD